MGCSQAKSVPSAPTPVEDLDGQIFLMVNGTSGGQASKQLLELGCDDFEFTTKRGGKKVKVWVFNLRESKSRSQGFQKLKEEVERTKSGKAKAQVRVVACGGDGTVKWVISELSKVDCLKIPIGVIPFGTGNDFSRAQGWGASAPSPLVGKNMSALKARMETVFFGQVGPLDTWLVDITLRDGGKFHEVKDSKITETHAGQKTITHEMINYFSIGADAQIVFDFEQARTKSQIGNKWVYVKKGTGQMFNRPKKLKKMLAKEHGLRSEGKDIAYRNRDRVLAFLNIPSYSAGANLWRPGKGKNTVFTKQFVGDKRLECLSVHTTTDVAMHIASGNRSQRGVYRVAQSGQYDLDFQDKAQVYLQVDGEALRCTDIEKVTIRHGYQVSVLRSPLSIASSGTSGKQLAAAPEQVVIELSEEKEQHVSENQPISDDSDSDIEEEKTKDAEEDAQELAQAVTKIQNAFRKRKQVSEKKLE